MAMDLRDKVRRYLPGYRLTADHDFNTFSAMKTDGVPFGVRAVPARHPRRARSDPVSTGPPAIRSSRGAPPR